MCCASGYDSSKTGGGIKNEKVYFCCEVCKVKFDTEPDNYMMKSTATLQVIPNGLSNWTICFWYNADIAVV